MYYKKYESENLYLSPMNPDDYQTYTKWVNDESLARGISNFKLNITDLSEKEWIEKICKDGKHNYSIIKKDNNELIWNYSVELKDDISRRYHVGGFIGEKENRGKGYGTEALKLITKYAFEILNAETIFSGIYAFNEASLKSAKKAGYNEAGRYRNAYYYNGKFNDEVLIEITRKAYENQKNKVEN